MGKKNETPNPNTKPSQNSSNFRVQWTSRLTTIFCEACVDEVFKGNRTNIHNFCLNLPTRQDVNDRVKVVGLYGSTSPLLTTCHVDKLW